MKRKVFLLAALAVLMLVVGFNTVAQGEDTLLIWADITRAPLLTELGAQFEEEFGIKVDVQQIGLADGRDQLLVAGPVGEGPDLLIVAHDHIGQLVANGAIVPLNRGDLEGTFTESSLDLFTFNDQLWGVPYAQENIALIRNVDLVPQAPTTWQEVQAIGEQLVADGTASYPIVIQTNDTYHNFPVTSAFGGYIFGRNNDGSFDVSDLGLNSEGGLAAGTWLSDMYTSGLMPPDVTDDVAFELFTNGETAMIITGPWWSSRIVEAAEAGGFEYSIDPFPGAEGGLETGVPFSGGQGFVISAFSDNQLLAETFLLDFVATLEFQQALFDADNRLPAFIGVDTSAEPNLEGFIAAGAEAFPMPAIAEMGAVWAASNNALTLISQGADPVESLNVAVEQIADAIKLTQSTDRIVVVAGDLQSEAGCDGDWDPACLVTQLFDEDGDGVFTATFSLPAGEYQFKVAMNGGWDENYGVDGAAGGDNIPLSLSADSDVTFTYDDSTNIVVAEVAE